MMNLTDEKKKKLAELCGGRRWWSHESGGHPSEPGWFFPSLREENWENWGVIMDDVWLNSNHRDYEKHLVMLMLAIAKKCPNISFTFRPEGCVDVYHDDLPHGRLENDVKFAEAVIATGLECVG